MWDDKSSLYNAARMMGIQDTFNMTDEQLEQVKAKLIEQKPLVRKYWSTAGEIVNLFASGEMWISYTWGGYMAGELQDEHPGQGIHPGRGRRRLERQLDDRQGQPEPRTAPTSTSTTCCRPRASAACRG